mmetsp:Transcript_16893/g.42977  ORF Transcript_16893/g.42977 Transcript_16893/m.42977 type:complete len:218 (+) Transcript_16893:237-890(+)
MSSALSFTVCASKMGCSPKMRHAVKKWFSSARRVADGKRAVCRCGPTTVSCSDSTRTTFVLVLVNCTATRSITSMISPSELSMRDASPFLTSAYKSSKLLCMAGVMSSLQRCKCALRSLKVGPKWAGTRQDMPVSARPTPTFKRWHSAICSGFSQSKHRTVPEMSVPLQALPLGRPILDKSLRSAVATSIWTMLLQHTVCKPRPKLNSEVSCSSSCS